jgi:hypothetical protein
MWRGAGRAFRRRAGLIGGCAFLALLGACARGDHAAPHEEATTPHEAAAAPPAPQAEPAEAAAPGVAGAEVERGICPFECCTYGRWSALAEVPVYAAEADTSRIAFRLSRGEEFTARTGNVHLDPVGLAVARDTLTLTPPGDSLPLHLSPGDTVQVLSPVGEGFFRMRVRGRVVEAEGFWAMTRPGRTRPMGELLRRPGWSWWVEVQNAKGQSGWLAMSELSGKIWGADSCAGPAPSTS